LYVLLLQFCVHECHAPTGISHSLLAGSNWGGAEGGTEGSSGT
jgi:hypothetical protein